MKEALQWYLPQTRMGGYFDTTDPVTSIRTHGKMQEYTNKPQ